MSLTVDKADLVAEADRITRAALQAAKSGLADVIKALERDIEDLTRQAVPGRLWRAVASAVYPKGQAIAREPTGEVFVPGKVGSRSRGAFVFWSQPGRIRPAHSKFLAIPLPAAGSKGRGRMLTPVEWEARHNVELRFVARPGKAPLLVADLGTTNLRTGTFRRITRARTAADARRGFQRGVQTVPIFVLVPTIAFGNRISMESAIRKAEASLPGAVGTRLAQI